MPTFEKESTRSSSIENSYQPECDIHINCLIESHITCTIWLRLHRSPIAFFPGIYSDENGQFSTQSNFQIYYLTYSGQCYIYIFSDVREKSQDTGSDCQKIELALIMSLYLFHQSFYYGLHVVHEAFRVSTTNLLEFEGGHLHFP